ncbi:flap endonuclease 1-like [Sycon ciliatum]|uniref:flap endonuclease 1-like n=1 Tax=Sycon ciliatum TaxID=27933 RepID=UPI0020AC1BFB|eukprot:scpid70417/ scgid27680/ Flap endonuclease 1; Flap structure-specific endonuclease 1
MGIHQLSKVLGDHAPGSMKDHEIKAYFGRKVAIDASMSLYQFLIAVRSDGSQLTDEQGETTSHLMGMFYRTIRMVDNGLKPAYVFDGKPPNLKSGELQKRTERRKEAEAELKQAEDAGDQENIERYQRRLVKVTPQHNEECKKLLTLMGIPVVSAPCEAEAQCAALVRAGKVFATATEDMDALTFGSTVLLRHLTFSEAKKMPIREVQLDRALAEMELTKEEFIDLCILLGCDYCDSIRGIGPQRALALIRQYHTIEAILENLDTKKYTVPENWLYKEARQLFLDPEVSDAAEIELKWTAPDEEALVQFMVTEKGFNEERIRNGIRKLAKARTGATQGRLDSFFTVKPAAPSAVKRPAAAAKGTPAKKAKASGGGRGKPRR